MKTDNLSQFRLKQAYKFLKIVQNEKWKYCGNYLFNGCEIYLDEKTGRMLMIKNVKYIINGASLFLLKHLTYIDELGNTHFLSNQK